MVGAQRRIRQGRWVVALCDLRAVTEVTSLASGGGEGSPQGSLRLPTPARGGRFSCLQSQGAEWEEQAWRKEQKFPNMDESHTPCALRRSLGWRRRASTAETALTFPSSGEGPARSKGPANAHPWSPRCPGQRAGARKSLTGTQHVSVVPLTGNRCQGIKAQPRNLYWAHASVVRKSRARSALV